MMDYTQEFQQFWKKYPSRWHRDSNSYIKRKKAPAFKSWQKLSQEIRDKCLRIVGQIKKSEGGAVRDAFTWLNEEGWDDIEEAKEVHHLPTEFTNTIKIVSEEINANNERNRQMKALKGGDL